MHSVRERVTLGLKARLHRHRHGVSEEKGPVRRGRGQQCARKQQGSYRGSSRQLAAALASSKPGVGDRQRCKTTASSRQPSHPVVYQLVGRRRMVSRPGHLEGPCASCARSPHGFLTQAA